MPEAEGLEVLVESARLLLPGRTKGSHSGWRTAGSSKATSCSSASGAGRTRTISAWTRSGSSLVAPSRSTTPLRAIGIDGGWLYAIGDVNGRAPLTHMGKYHARLAGDAILGREVSAAAGHRALPRVTFTDPQVAAVGLTEDQAREQSLDVRAVIQRPATWPAPTPGERHLGDKQARRRRAAPSPRRRHLHGPDVQELSTRRRSRSSPTRLDTLWHAIPSFLTVSEVWLRLLRGYGLSEEA